MGFSGTNGDPDFSELISRLAATQEYPVLFNFVFGSPTIDETRIQDAIAQFVRSIQSFDSKYDAGRAVAQDPQPFPNFTASENRGKQLYLGPPAQGGAGCAVCHRPPEFDIDPNSRNNGVTAAIGGGTDLTNTRSPSLRNLTDPTGQLNGPLMHNGSFTIAQVINHYAAIPGNNPNLDPRLRRPGGQVQVLNLTPQDRADLEAFLLTLSGNAVYTDQRWSNPFSAAGTITVINIPPSPNSDRDGYRNPHGNGNSHGHINSHLDPDPQSNLNPEPDADSHANTNLHSNSKSSPKSHAHTGANLHPNPDAHTNSRSKFDPDPERCTRSATQYLHPSRSRDRRQRHDRRLHHHGEHPEVRSSSAASDLL